MPYSEEIFDAPIPPVERPHCSRCGGQMWLTSIAPDKENHDRRTFECPECEYIETVVVEIG